MKNVSCKQGSLLDMPTPVKKTPPLPDVKKSMSKLERLMEELCPNGVEYKKLEDVIISLNTGLNPRNFFHLNTDDAKNYYVTIREMHNNRIQFSDKTDRINDNALILCNNRSNLEIGDVLFSGTGTIGEVALVESAPFNWNIKEGIYAIKPQKDKLSSKFLLFLMKNTHIRNLYISKAAGGTVKSVSMGELKNIKIPVPPLPVQKEIVRILDTFSEFTYELTYELTTELNKIKQQYEYCREKLFNFSNSIPKIPLKDLAINCDSKRKPVTKGNREAGKYPYYGASGIVDYVKDYIFDGDYLLISEDGANLLARNTPIAFSITGKTWVNNHAHILQFSNITLQKYVEIYLNSIDLTKYISTAAQPKLTQDNLNKILIPKPSDEKINRIVSILDRFDALCNDLSSGLPAEIEARKKQYEYYRDRLLTFREAK